MPRFPCQCFRRGLFANKQKGNCNGSGGTQDCNSNKLKGITNQFTLPDLDGGDSEILEEEDVRNIAKHLTPRVVGIPWTLIFSSSHDGFSLKSLYRRNNRIQDDCPVMLIVRDTNSRAFGALVSCSLHTSNYFYGTGQSFLFTLRPDFKVYKWTGDNLLFVKGNPDGIWIGAGDGKFGLYIDGDLNCGRTESCQTYGNSPLTEPQDFLIKTLECWAFIL